MTINYSNFQKKEKIKTTKPSEGQKAEKSKERRY